MRLILTVLLLSLLSGCFAQRLELEDPMGLPLAQPQLGVSVDGTPQLAQQLQQELIQLLPRERQVQAQAGGGDWQLKAELRQQRQLLEAPLTFFGPVQASRVHMELALTVALSAPDGQVRHWELVQRGDAQPAAEAQLTQELLRRLRDRLLRELQPRYVYR